MGFLKWLFGLSDDQQKPGNWIEEANAEAAQQAADRNRQSAEQARLRRNTWLAHRQEAMKLLTELYNGLRKEFRYDGIQLLEEEDGASVNVTDSRVRYQSVAIIIKGNEDGTLKLSHGASGEMGGSIQPIGDFKSTDEMKEQFKSWWKNRKRFFKISN